MRMKSIAMELHGHEACQRGNHQHDEWAEVWCPECEEYVYCPCSCHDEENKTSGMIPVAQEGDL